MYKVQIYKLTTTTHTVFNMVPAAIMMSCKKDSLVKHVTFSVRVGITDNSAAIHQISLSHTQKHFLIHTHIYRKSVRVAQG